MEIKITSLIEDAQSLKNICYSFIEEIAYDCILVENSAGTLYVVGRNDCGPNKGKVFVEKVLSGFLGQK
jgi:hypothetical protein